MPQPHWWCVALALALGLVVLASPQAANAQTWTTAKSNNVGVILKDGVPVVTRGFVVTCTQYLLRGIGTQCLAAYNWSNKSEIISTVDQSELNAIYAYLLPAPAGVVPTLRLALTAGYWLDVSTPSWSSNRAQYPNLAQQYRTLVQKVVADATSRGVVVILDLHWNNDVQEQTAMALKGASGGDSVQFFSSLAATFGSNSNVWYELYNEPFLGNNAVWMSGNAQYAGMVEMAQAILAVQAKGLILVAGSASYAYDDASLVLFAQTAPAAVMARTVFVVHPYMGPYQAGDSKKNVDGFVTLVNNIKAYAPIIATEFGQYCCAANGACYLYSGSYNGKSMGYVEALLNVFETYGVGWTIWGYRPNSGSGDCNQPDVNDGKTLYSSALHSGNGADFKSLYPKYYPGTATSPVGSPVTALPTRAPTQAPTRGPTRAPTQAPTRGPTKLPTRQPTTPTIVVQTPNPTQAPTNVPTPPSKAPSGKPSTQSTAQPTVKSSKAPTAKPTKKPTRFPTAKPTKKPTQFPTAKPTKKPTPAPSRKPNGSGCGNAVWAQCGGTNFSGATCCPASATCVKQDASYSQCKPVTVAPGATASPTACAATYGQCGGTGWAVHCCQDPDDVCTVLNPYYHQCLPPTGRRLRAA